MTLRLIKNINTLKTNLKHIKKSTKTLNLITVNYSCAFSSSELNFNASSEALDSFVNKRTHKAILYKNNRDNLY
jgi:hypothetical protein